MLADDQLAPLAERTLALIGPVELFDAHTHIGVNDPDGFSCTADELLAALAPTGSRAVTFPMHEPAGYPPANDHVIAAARASGGRLVPFCRVDPGADPVAEIRRCVAAGAAGIKLHPRAERFELTAPGVGEILAEADAQRLPVLIHAGRGIPALGRHVLDHAARFPHARFILAHAGVCDLAWLWREVGAHPNVLFDTSWFSAADQLALFTHVAPGQIVYATDIPFGTPAQTIVCVLRCALQAGLGHEQLAGVAGGQLARVLARDELLDLGPPVGAAAVRGDPLLDRAGYFLVCAFAAAIAGGSSDEWIDLARLACGVGADAPQAEHCRAIVELLELAQQLPAGASRTASFARVHLLVSAAAIAATPDVAV